MGTRQVELPTYICTYCGYEALQLTQIKGQDGSARFLCGECMIKAFDTGLGYEPKPVVPEPLPTGQGTDTETSKPEPKE